jgi:phospholipid/cholesterol/gamma-HCH transport system substrate-binding protein
VTSFNQQLDGVSSILASNRQQLGTLLTTLNQSLAVITAFVNDNRGQVTTDLTSLRQLTTTIAGQRQHLADLLQVLPTAATDFSNIYDPVTAALTGIVAPLNGDSPASTLCSLFSNLNVGDSGCAAALSAVDGASPAFSALIPTLSSAQRNAYCNVVVAQPGAPTTDVTTQTCPSTTTSQRSLLAPGASR